jgi:hypothetical protein
MIGIGVCIAFAKAKVGQEFRLPITIKRTESPVSGPFPVAGAGLNLRPPGYETLPSRSNEVNTAWLRQARSAEVS